MGDLVYFLKYLYYLIKYKIFIWLSLIVAAAIFDGLSVGLFLPILEGPDSNSWLSRFIRDVFESVNLEYSLGTILIVMMIFYLIRTAALTFQEIYVKRIETHLLVFLKSDLIDKLFSAKYLYFIRKEIGYFTNAVLLEYGRVAGAFEQCMGVMVSLGFAVVYLALPLAVNPVVTGVVVLLAVPGYFIMLKINSIVRSYSIQSTANHARLQSYLVQAFQSFKYLKATHSDDGILRKIYSATRLQGRLLYKQAVVLIAVEKSTDLVLLLSVSGLMFYYVEIRDAPLIEVLFLLFLMRRAMAYLLRTQLAYRKLVGVSGSIEVFKNLERELQENYEHSERGGSDAGFRPAHQIRAGFL